MDSPAPLLNDEVVRPTTPFLYKYGSADFLDYLKPILLNDQLYFPSPAQLNDPLDARPRLIVSSKQGAMYHLVNDYLAAHASDSIKSLAFHVGKIVELVEARSLQQLAVMMTPRLHEQMEGHRIYSMTTRPDNEYLWQHYAGNHTGYCLEFFNRGTPFDHARVVLYGNAGEVDLCSQGNLDGALLFRKTLKYQDEEEVRILVYPRWQPHEVPFDPALLNRIILGKYTSAEHRATISEWCRARRTPLPVCVNEERISAPQENERTLQSDRITFFVDRA